MIEIKYARLKDPESRALIDKYLAVFPEVIQAKIKRYRRVQDAQRGLLGKLLLLEILKHYGYHPSVLEQLKYSQYDRPYLDGKIDFNITHADEYVAIAASQVHKVGIDIEPIKEVNLNEFKAVFTEAELEEIRQATDSSHHFFTLWTQKEALIKADGMGMSLPLQEIIVRDNKAHIGTVEWFLTKIDIDERYIAHLATEVAVDRARIRVEEVIF
ncbi:MAG: hypothetical protein DHS20C18_45460 [Saprospiraceae bacterium]|nr:MAG: hypothetical protein DHS20C18_45460 [Saprospiraceae bacterium]